MAASPHAEFGGGHPSVPERDDHSVATVSVDGSGSDDETFRAWRPAYDSSTANAAATTSPSHVEAEIILQRPNLQAVHRTDTGISNGNGAHHENNGNNDTYPPRAPGPVPWYPTYLGQSEGVARTAYFIP